MWHMLITQSSQGKLIEFQHCKVKTRTGGGSSFKRYIKYYTERNFKFWVKVIFITKVRAFLYPGQMRLRKESTALKHSENLSIIFHSIASALIKSCLLSCYLTPERHAECELLTWMNPYEDTALLTKTTQNNCSVKNI